MSKYNIEQLRKTLRDYIERGKETFGFTPDKARNGFVPGAIDPVSKAVYTALEQYRLPDGAITWATVRKSDEDVMLIGFELYLDSEELISLSTEDVTALIAIYTYDTTKAQMRASTADVQVTINILDSVFYWGKDVAKGQPHVELRACLSEPYRLRGEQSLSVPVGLSCRHENPGFIGMIVPAGIFSENPYVGITGAPHIIPAGTETELRVMVQNHRDVDRAETVVINPGDVLAHLIYLPVATPNFTLGTVAEPKTDSSDWDVPAIKFTEKATALMNAINDDIAALPEHQPVSKELTQSEVNYAITWIESRIAHHMAGAENPVSEVRIDGLREWPGVDFECEVWGRQLSFPASEIARIAAAHKEPVKEVEGEVDDLSEQQRYFLKVMHSFKLKGPQKETFFEPATATALKMPESRGPESQNGRLAIMLTQQLEGTPVEKIEAKITPWILHEADLDVFKEGMEIIMAGLGFKGEFRVSIPEIMSDEEDPNLKVPCPITVSVPGGGVLFDQKRFDWFMAVIQRFEEEVYGQG